MELALLALLLVAIALLVALLLRRGGGDAGALKAELLESEARARADQQGALGAQLKPVVDAIARVEATLKQQLDDGLRRAREEQTGALRAAREEQATNLQAVAGKVDARLEAIREANERKLEQMRQTVDEKLHATLEARLGQAFQRVSENLEKVHQGLGEMRSLAQDVGGLKRVLSNVKTRGVLGEAQLGALLEQFLAPDQYEANVKVKPRSEALVEYAVKLPGPEDGKRIWLPLDAKFPVEDYQRLLEAHERGDPAAMDEAGRALEQRVLGQAREIRDKYIAPPATTDFAVLFLPYEGLYAEVLRRPGLFERVNHDYHVTITGPTTLVALLNALQVGFRTLAISKQSAEVWKLLGRVKTEFGRFGDALAAAQKKLDEASDRLGTVSERKDRMLKALGKVETHPELEAGEEPPALPRDGERDPAD